MDRAILDLVLWMYSGIAVEGGWRDRLRLNDAAEANCSRMRVGSEMHGPLKRVLADEPKALSALGGPAIRLRYSAGD